MDSRERFSWSDDDVVLKDADGKEITKREVLEQQLVAVRQRLRAEQDEGDEPDSKD